MNALRRFLSAEHEPVRRYVYSVLLAVLGLLVTFGVLTDADSAAIAVAAGSVLLVGIPGVELARSKVTPWRDEERLS